ncbi:helix-turn-helix transcriptional regulator [Nonomuraea endophytica]|uniref:helix-turn-helix transcriptional regulator n=1 Tax=Nonomuraea endophytica TaxID=714136 RepID=UPI0037C5EB15
MLQGRKSELAAIERLLGTARAGGSGALVLRGEPGVGKSALLEHAGRMADGFAVLRGSAVESESELPFAALHQILRPVLDHLDALPEPQAAAVRTAFGLATGGVADRFMIGLATLTLLAENAPLLCLIDDAQWLDRASAEALLFAARRLHAEGVAMLVSARDEASLAGLPELRVEGLDRADAQALLAGHLPGLPPHVRDRVVEESGGNPLALLELPASALAEVGPLPLPRRLQEAFGKRIAVLPSRARSALVVAAAADTGELGTILAATRELGLPDDALAQAEGLVSVQGSTVSFRHSLTRAAAYQSAGFVERLAVHRALAVTATDADRRAWHLAAAATGPDEEVAAGLEAAAERARDRTGYAAAAAALERAAHLTPDPGRRLRRLTAAAQTAADAGQNGRAGGLVEEALRLSGDPDALATLRAKVAFEDGDSRAAYTILIEAADRAEGEARVRLLTDAARAAWTRADPAGMRRVHGLLAGLPGQESLAAAIGGAAELMSGDPGEGLRILSENVAAMPQRRAGLVGERLATVMVDFFSGDFARSRETMLVLAGEFRQRGMIGWLAGVLGTLAEAEFFLGRFHEAAASVDETVRIAGDTGQRQREAHARGLLAALAAVRGEEEKGEGEWAERAGALLDLGRGRFEAALERMEQLTGQNHALYFAPDQVEAAVRLGRPDRAAEPLERFERWARAAGQPWADAVLARCRALLAEAPEELFALAVQDGARPFEQARSRLLFGEWLRRERRKAEARTQLRAALETFERAGAHPWAEHARAELRAAGETAAQVAPDAMAALTPQELQVVRLAATGATNKEIGAQLFLSPKTVGHHLYRAFPKLGVATRTELAHLFS